MTIDRVKQTFVELDLTQDSPSDLPRYFVSNGSVTVSEDSIEERIVPSVDRINRSPAVESRSSSSNKGSRGEGRTSRGRQDRDGLPFRQSHFSNKAKPRPETKDSCKIGTSRRPRKIVPMEDSRRQRKATSTPRFIRSPVGAPQSRGSSVTGDDISVNEEDIEMDVMTGAPTAWFPRIVRVTTTEDNDCGSSDDGFGSCLLYTSPSPRD